jgi:hypothetical protein
VVACRGEAVAFPAAGGAMVAGAFAEADLAAEADTAAAAALPAAADAGGPADLPVVVAGAAETWPAAAAAALEQPTSAEAT